MSDPASNGAAGGYQFSKLYSSTEWSSLRLPSYVAAFDSDDNAPTVLQLFPSIAAWAP